MTLRPLRLRSCLVVATALLAAAPGAAANQRSVVGHSVQGRPIFAVREGSAEAKLRMLVVGCVHGDEPAGMRVARGLLGRRPPRGAQLWVVPTLNPDGVAAGTRGNAHGVDLNRNFPFAWLPLGGGEYSGPRPLSEPESRAAVRLIRRVRPQVTIWFHQPFGVVDSSGGDVFVERRFSQLIGLPLVRLRRYPGSASRWQNHALRGSTAFVVELPQSVRSGLVRRAVDAVRSLAAELASPGVETAER
jgi:protein MpaA